MRTRPLQRALSLIILLPVAVFVVGCGSKEPEPVEVEPPPPPPTPQEIAAKIVSDLGLEAALPSGRAGMAKAESDKFLGIVRTAKTQQSASKDGKLALKIVSQKLDARLRQLEDKGLWEHVLLYFNAHLVFNPKSHKFDTSRDRAVSELRKPRVTINGFHEDGNTGQTTVFINFYLPIEQQNHRERVRVGEELYGLKLVNIIGKNQGITMEYIETGQTFDILTASAQK